MRPTQGEPPRRAQSPRRARPSPAAGRSRPRASAACRAEALEPRTLLSLPPAGPEVRVPTAIFHPQHTALESRPVATDAAGNFVVVWESDDFATGDVANGGILRGQRFSAGGARLGADFRIDNTSADQAFYAQDAAVAMDAAGNFVVAWRHGENLYTQRYNAAGVALGGNTLIATDVSAGLDLAMDADGDYILAWVKLPDFLWEHYGIYVQRFNATGAPRGGFFQANSDTSRSHYVPSIATDAAGDFIVGWQAWQSVNGGPYKDEIRLFDANGNPRGNEFAFIPDQYSTTPPSVAMDGAGNYMVAWERYEGPNDSDWEVFVRLFNAAGGVIGADYALPAAGGNQPTIVSNADGHGLLGWVAETDNGLGFDLKPFGPIGSTGFSESLDTPLRHDALRLGLAMQPGGDGNFVAAWTMSENFQPDVHARRFASAPLGTNTGAGRVFNDANANGVLDDDERGLAGRQVYQDVNNNGQFDSGVVHRPRPVEPHADPARQHAPLPRRGQPRVRRRRRRHRRQCHDQPPVSHRRRPHRRPGQPHGAP